MSVQRSKKIRFLLPAIILLIILTGCAESANLYRNRDFRALADRVDQLEQQTGYLEPVPGEVPGIFYDTGPVGEMVYPGAVVGPAQPVYPSAAPVLSPSEVRSYYREARSLFKKGRYEQAAVRFQRIADQAPGHTLAPNALYWLGECYYSRGDYQTAIARFNRVVQEYPASDKAPDAMLKISYSLSRLNAGPEAMNYLQALLTRYPRSRAAQKVRAGKTAFKRLY